MKLAHKISLSIFLVAMLGAAAACGGLYLLARRSLETEIGLHLAAVARARADHIATYLAMLNVSVAQLSKSSTLENFMTLPGAGRNQTGPALEQTIAYLRRIKAANPLIDEFLLMDHSGQVIASTRPASIGMDKTADAIFFNAREKPFIKDVYYSDEFQEPLLAVSTPMVSSQTGDFLGVLAARMKMNDLNAICAERTGLGASGEIYLVNQAGLVITPTKFQPDAVLKLKVTVPPAGPPQPPGGWGYKAEHSFDYRKVPVLRIHSVIPAMPWSVCVEIDAQEALAPLAAILRALIIILLGVPLLAGLTGVGMARVITRSLTKLRHGAEIIGAGNLDHKVATSAQDEIGQLSRAFDRMTANLKHTTTSIDHLNLEIAGREQAEKELNRIEWMLSDSSASPGQDDTEATGEKGYGDLTELNRDGLILRSVGKELLKNIAGDYLNLMGTSSAIYEKNGAYAFGIFSSHWCRFLDRASRKLCAIGDNTTALNSGRWLCHESCWTHCSKEAIARRAPVDIECNGGIQLFAVPIFAGQEVIGAINFGYGDPPSDPAKLKAIAELYQVSFDELVTQARAYNTRPAYLVEMAKKRLLASAKLIGVMVERKQAEEKLRERTAELFEREEDLAITLRSIGDALITTDLEGRITRMNPVAEQLTGWSLAEAAGKPLADIFRIINVQTRELVQNPIIEALASGKVVTLANHTALVAHDGTERQIADSAAPIMNETGSIRGAVLVFHDMTDQYRIKETLREQRDFSNKLIDTQRDTVFLFDPARGQPILWNKRFTEASGYSDEEIAAKKAPDDFYSAADLAKARTAMTDIFTTGHGLVELNLINKQGVPISFEYSAGIIKAADGRDLILSIGRNISERKRAEEALKASEQRFRLLFDYATDAIFIQDPRSNFMAVNQTACDRLGYSREELLQLSPREIDSPEFAAQLTERIATLHRKGQVVFESAHVRRNGSVIPVEINAKMIEYNGRPAIFAIARDMTERKEDEEKLRKAKTDLEKAYQQLQESFKLETQLALEAQAASDAKSQFVANISHEIRTPLNGIIGICELLLGTRMSAEQKEYAQTINSSAEALLNIINATLDFSKINAGKMELEKMDFNLRSVFEDIIGLLAVNAAQKQIELIGFIEPATPLNLNGDPGRLRQILFNLIGNAVKFTTAGEILVTVALVEEKESLAYLRFTVRDTGIGIPPEKIKLLFQAFSQVDDSSTRKFGGTGLGLAICKGLVEQMGGQIGVDSAPGRGSSFWFEVPFAKQLPAASRAEAPEAAFNGQRILLVDDNHTLRTVLARQLQAWGAATEGAAGGAEALAILRQASGPDQKAFQAVIIDQSLPEMDGLTLAATIKAAPEFQALPIILMTALVLPADLAAEYKHLFADIILKPIRQAPLASSLLNALSNAPQAPLAASAAAAWDHAAHRPLRILVVEDNITNQKVICGILKKMGHTAIAVANGKEALQSLAMVPYQLVLMDIQMPEMDGYQATALIRSRGAPVLNPAIPILALTAHALEDDREKCLAAGMNGYLSKPVTGQALAQAIAGLGAAADRPASVRADPPPAESAPEVFAANNFAERLLNNHQLLREVSELFLTDTPPRLRELTQTIRAHNRAASMTLAHTLKGSAANVSGRQLQATAAQIEKLCAAADWRAAEAQAPNLAIQFGLLAQAMRAFLQTLTQPGAPP